MVKFTTEDYKKIALWLAQYSIKDSEFVTKPGVTENSFIIVVNQDNNGKFQNWKIPAKLFFQSGLKLDTITSILVQKLLVDNELKVKASNIILPDANNLSLEDVLNLLSVSFVPAINDLNSYIGKLGQLNTLHKNNLVEAINEVNTDVLSKSPILKFYTEHHDDITITSPNLDNKIYVSNSTIGFRCNQDSSTIILSADELRFSTFNGDTTIVKNGIWTFGLSLSINTQTNVTTYKGLEIATKNDLTSFLKTLVRYEEDYYPRRSPQEPIKECAKITTHINGEVVIPFEANPRGGVGLGNNTLTWDNESDEWKYKGEELATKQYVEELINKLKNS